MQWPPLNPSINFQPSKKAVQRHQQQTAALLFKHAVVLHHQGQLVQSKSLCEQVLAIQPSHIDALHLLGVIALQSQNLEAGLILFGQAIEIKPDFIEAHVNHGYVLQQLQRLEEADTSFNRAIEIKSDYAQAHFYKAISLLLGGKFEPGWSAYEWRWKYDKFTSPRRNLEQPLWIGNEDIAGKAILVHAEQGLGDTIQFCRYTKLVKDLGARVLLEAPKSLVGLLSSLEGVDTLIESGSPLPKFDYHCPVLSLPLAFKTQMQTIPQPKPYLFSDPQKCELWEKRLTEKTGLRVGLVWSGGASHSNDHLRSLALEMLLRQLPRGCHYVSLQKDVREIDKKALAESAIQHFGDDLQDFSETAALCDLVDLVISVDTSVAHLAGALGKPTWILLPYSPDWRWLLDRHDSPWYESVRLYRQDQQLEWMPVLSRVANDLQQLLKSNV